MQKCLKQIVWHKYTTNKKAIMTLVCRYCNETILTKLALRTTYEINRNDGNLVNFLDRLGFVCYQSNDSGLSYTPYKGIIEVKLSFNFTNPRPEDPHGYKEELKVKHSATTPIVRKFPNEK